MPAVFGTAEWVGGWGWLKRLPAVVIGEELADDDEAYRELRHLRRSGPFYVKTLGRFDPEAAAWQRQVNPSSCALVSFLIASG